MTHRHISIKVEGDFIDSFIYSGTLFLVNSNSQITTYNWGRLLRRIFGSNNLSDREDYLCKFLIDCRRGMQPREDEPEQRVDIENNVLQEEIIDTLFLEGWPTDINVYSNHLYIANENGVERIKYNQKSKKLIQETRSRIWEKYAYKISPNNYSRIAIAAGSNGIITAFPERNSIVTAEIDIDSVDCEWIGNNLVANSMNGAFLSIFESLPSRPANPTSDFYDELDRVKKTAPNTKKLENVGEQSVIYVWLAGNKLFSLLSNGQVIVDKGNLPLDGNLTSSDSQSRIELPVGSPVLAAKSALFGAVIEIKDELLSFREDGIRLISNRPVSWRVFPRSKNYLNHLHIIENDCLLIHAYFVDANGNTDNYGISFEDVII